MAFECHDINKVGFSNNTLSSVDTNSREQVEFHLPRTEFDRKDPNFEPKIEFEPEIPKPISEIHPKRGVLTSCSGKVVPGNEALSSFPRSITDLPSALISEILNCLDPKELGIVSCVSTTLFSLASEHAVWKEFYCERWGQPITQNPLGSGFSDEKTWKELFVEREFQSKTFLGRYNIDVLHGHTEAVLTVFLLASKKLVFTSGYDSVVRVWDMEGGMAITSSPPLGCTIRAVAADTKVLIAGGTDGFIQGWRAEEGLSYLFDLKGPRNQNTVFRLWEHQGPITCLALDLTRIYSGSWDMTARVWDRSSLKCLQVLRHSDWVWNIVPHDTTVASASGSDVYVWDSNTGVQINAICNAHAGNTFSLARSHTGKLLFTGGEDGAIHMFDMSNNRVAEEVATWAPHSGPVNSLAFEFPWLVSASSDGKLSLIDVRKLLKVKSGNRKRQEKNLLEKQSVVEPPQRMLHGFASNLFSVAIGSDRIVCGGEEGIIRVWDFSQALAKERKARALRGMRLENRMRRRKLQVQMNKKSEQCSVAANGSMNGDRSGVWRSKRRVGSGKAKA